MSTLTKPFTFTGGTFAVAAQVNSDFDTVYGWINGGSAIWADASRSFTAIPSGPNANPTSGNQFTRKTYVDGRVLNGDSAPGGANGIIKWGGAHGPNSVTFSAGSANLTFTNPFPNLCQSAVANVTLNNPWTVEVVSVSASFIALRCWNTNTGAFLTGAAGIEWFAGGF